MNQDERIRMIIKGRLAEYYEAFDAINRIELEIMEIQKDMYNPKAIRYDKEGSTGSLTHDEILARYITKLDELKAKQDTYRNQAAGIEKALHLYALSEKERQIMMQVYNTDTYEEAGKNAGYTAVQVCRIMRGIFEFLKRYLPDIPRETETQVL